MDKKKTHAVRLKEDEYNFVKAMADRNNESFSAAVRRIVIAYMRSTAPLK